MKASVRRHGPFSLELFSFEERDSDNYIVEQKELTVDVGQRDDDGSRSDDGPVVYTLRDADQGRSQRYGELVIELARAGRIHEFLDAVVGIVGAMLRPDVIVHGTDRSTVPLENNAALVSQALVMLRYNLPGALRRRQPMDWENLTVRLRSFEHPDIDMIADQDEWENNRVMWKIEVR